MFNFVIASYIVPELVAERAAKRTRDNYMNRIVAYAKQKIESEILSPDLATILTTATDENGKKVFTEHEIKSQLFTFAFGGHETTTSTLIWAPEFKKFVSKNYPVRSFKVIL